MRSLMDSPPCHYMNNTLRYKLNFNTEVRLLIIFFLSYGLGMAIWSYLSGCVLVPCPL